MMFLLVLIPLISAVPPQTTVQQFERGFRIVEEDHEYIQLNKNYQYNFFVYNQTNGLLVSNSSVNCTFYLANKTGNVLFSKKADYSTTDLYWNVFIEKGNFSIAGNYPYGVTCQNSYGGGIIRNIHSDREWD